jgi:hypothetical protein
MSDEKHALSQRVSQLESDLRVTRAALAKAQEELAALKGTEEAPRRGRQAKPKAE